MKTHNTRIIAGIFCAIAVVKFSTADAQKLADIQEKNMLAPAKVKVDGKPLEWDNGFQAYNKATLVYYTLANDEKNLYLVVQSTDKTVTNKIMRGGITFSLNLDGKKKENEGPTITFPVVGATDMRSMMQAMRPPGTATPSGGGQVRVEMGPGDLDAMMKRADSVMNEANKKQIAALKEIKVLRVKGITDSLVSIYNEYGVKAMASFDAKGAFTYELAVPLEVLGLSASSPKEFAYNIKLNGLQIQGMRMNVGGPGAEGAMAGGGGPVMVMSAGGGGGVPRAMQDMMSMLSPTFFWGKYTLAKK